MGGQACVLYGAAQFSKDIDFALFADEENYRRLHEALAALDAKRIAIPRFDPAILDRGHAVHFRCQAEGVEGLRVDVMTRQRGLPDFETMWNRRTTLDDERGTLFEVMAVEDLVQAKKTQREKDWPMISALVENHYHVSRHEPNPDRIEFWLIETRVAERLQELCRQFSNEAAALFERRPLLRLSQPHEINDLRAALDAEMRAEKEKDRIYWEPLLKELEQFRHEERGQSRE